MAMKCQHCGKENPETEAFCKHCGRELGQMGTRNCVACGRAISWDTLVCPYCGKDYRYQSFAGQPQGPLVGSGIKVLLYIVSFFIPIVGFIVGAIYYTKPEDEYKKLGKTCITLGIVSLVVNVGLAALLYVMILGFGGTSIDTPAVMVVSKTSVEDGFKFTLSASTAPVVWSDVTIQVSDTMDFASWHPDTDDLTSTSANPVTQYYGIRGGLTGIDVELSVTDLAGNGRISNGDFFTLTAADGAFSAGTTYMLNLIFEPTGGDMVWYSFTA
jgi:RNA polymerase subunit RPABC4/transcription elongation factor Spt4